MAHGQWETDTVDDPMISTSIRLPKSVLDEVRARAGAEGIKATAWIRRLVERELSGDTAPGESELSVDLARRVAALEAVVLPSLSHELTNALSSEQELPGSWRASAERLRRAIGAAFPDTTLVAVAAGSHRQQTSITQAFDEIRELAPELAALVTRSAAGHQSDESREDH
ncbi:MAG: hypothetical protein GEU98_05720 [Pseudonocardiaceae bacterium]|nr:hypothetical protein [Pseudonocardiaceae bacterium]